MLGIHYLDNGNDYSKDELYYYEEVYANGNSNQFIADLHKDKNLIELYCTCNGDRIPLNTNFNWTKDGTKTYYIENWNGTINNHTEDCDFKGNQSNLKPSWNKVGDNIEVFIPLPKKTVTNHSSHPSNVLNTMPSNRNQKVTKNMQNEKTLAGFLRNLISESWEIKTYKEQKTISFEEFYGFMIYYTKYIKANGKYKLNDILCNAPYNKSNNSNFYRQKNVRSMRNSPGYMFVISKFIGKRNIDDNKYEIVLSNIRTNENFKYICDKSIWDDAVSINTVTEPPFIVGGYARYNRKVRGIQLFSCAVVPISNNGVFVESSYERRLYNYLHQENRIFVKPYKAYYSFKNMKPDGILVDTAPKCKTIIEVFGESKDNIIYHKRRLQKIKHFSSLKKYNFWKWDAYLDSSTIPDLPPKGVN